MDKYINGWKTTLIYALFTLLLSTGGWFLKTAWAEIQLLKQNQNQVSLDNGQRITKVETKLDDLKETVNKVDKKLDKLLEKGR